MTAQVTTEHHLDRKTAAQAYAKAARGETPTRTEQAALKRFERRREEELRWKYYRSIPKKHWKEMSGRQVKVINEQAQRYGIPFGGPEISLPEVVKALHDFLAENAQKLARSDDPMMESPSSSPALERYREERALMARYDRLEREGKLVEVSNVYELGEMIASAIKSANRLLVSRFGKEAGQIYDDAIEMLNRRMDQWVNQHGLEKPDEAREMP